MKGKDLQENIKNSGKGISHWVQVTEIPRATIFSLYKKEEVEQHYIKKFVDSGLVVQKSTEKSVVDLESALTEIRLQKKIIDNLEDEVQFLRYLVSHENKLSFKKKGDVSQNKDAKQHD